MKLIPLIFVCLLGCGDGPVPSDPVPSESGHAIPPALIFVTREHDGHWWVMRWDASGYFVHHPDCPKCAKRAVEEVK